MVRGCGSRPGSAARSPPGDSVAVNGVCLTATAVDGDGFEAEAMNQTLDGHRAGRSRSRIARQPRAGDEGFRPPRRAHRAGARGWGGGGAAVERDGFARRLRVGLDPGLLRYAIDKGSIALDGVSLTIAALGESWLVVSLIPETLERTNLGEARARAQAQRRVRRRRQARGAIDDTIARKGAGVSQMTETPRRQRKQAARRARARSRRSRRRSRRSAAGAWSSSATARTARTRATW